jgi:hypothetical protein
MQNTELSDSIRSLKFIEYLSNNMAPEMDLTSFDITSLKEQLLEKK